MHNEQLLTQKRIEWVDVFKGLAIILMVVGHSTGRFNGFIYQFHMSMFFFISGYTYTHNRNELYTKFALKKAYRLLLPVFVVAIGMLFFMAVLGKFGLYSILFSEAQPYIGFEQGIKLLFTNGSMYAWWLGASWFMFTLFGIFMLAKLICAYIQNKYIMAILSIALYFIGIYFAGQGMGMQIYIFSLTNIFIGQFYFIMGYMCKSIKRRDISNIYYILLCIISFMIMDVFRQKGATVDYASLSFGRPILNIFASINGILFVYFVSSILSKYKIYKMFEYIGQNTLPIVIFHFMYFKITSIILIAMNIAPFEQLASFLPGPMENYWFVYSLLSILASIITWKILIKIKIIQTLLGENKNVIKYIDNTQTSYIRR